MNTFSPAATLDVGTVELIEDQAGQTVQFFVIPEVVPSEKTAGLNFNVQTGDGGTAAGGTIYAPAITAGDILTGTIFASNNTGQGGGGALADQVYEATTTTSSGKVSADGMLATVTFDTTGFFVGDGPFPLIMSVTVNGPTDFAGTPGVTLSVTDGQITLLQAPVVCSIPGHPALAVDFIEDCRINLLDFRELSAGWMTLYDLTTLSIMAEYWLTDLS